MIKPTRNRNGAKSMTKGVKNSGKEVNMKSIPIASLVAGLLSAYFIADKTP
jgi:hypothetical protein